MKKINKKTNKKSDEFEELLNVPDTKVIKRYERSERMKEIWRKRLEDPNYQNPKLKYDETFMITHWLDVYEWLMSHPEALFLGDYYRAEDSNPSIIYPTTKHTFGKFPIADEIRAEIKNELRDRLLRRALERQIDPTITKLILVNNHFTDEGTRYRERINQDITVTNTNIEFRFGNDIEDTDTEDTE